MFHHVCFRLRLHTHTHSAHSMSVSGIIWINCAHHSREAFGLYHFICAWTRDDNGIIWLKNCGRTTLSSWISFGSKWKQKKLKEWNRLKQSQFKDFVLVILSWKFIPSIFVLYFHRFCHSTSTHKKNYGIYFGDSAPIQCPNQNWFEQKFREFFLD